MICILVHISMLYVISRLQQPKQNSTLKKTSLFEIRNLKSCIQFGQLNGLTQKSWGWRCVCVYCVCVRVWRVCKYAGVFLCMSFFGGGEDNFKRISFKVRCLYPWKHAAIIHSNPAWISSPIIKGKVHERYNAHTNTYAQVACVCGM